MNVENLNYLKENLKYQGFGDKLYAELEKNIQQRFPEFVLKTEGVFNKQTMEANLHFRRSDSTDMYFFNRWDGRIKNEAGVMEQTFYINKGHGVTLKEGFNLLEGRAVYKELANKEGEKYHAWIQLDLKAKEENGNYKTRQYHENYGYNLPAVLQSYTIKELGNEQLQERLLLSLQKGNVQSVTIAVNGNEQLFFLEANPQFKSVTMYDGQMKRLKREEMAELTSKPEAKQDMKTNQDNSKQTTGIEIKKSQPSESPEKKIDVQAGHAQSQELREESMIVGNHKDKSAGKNKIEAHVKKNEKTKSVKGLLPQKEETTRKNKLRAG
jgi:hypothetical protein